MKRLQKLTNRTSSNSYSTYHTRWLHTRTSFRSLFWL